MKAEIVQHSFGLPGSGGPVVALERLLANSTTEFGVIRQLEPARGINLGLIKRFIAELKAYQPSLVHVRGLGNEGFHAALAARLAKVPNILVSVHGTYQDLKFSPNQWKTEIVRSLLEPATLRFATHIATVCEFAAERAFLLPFRSKLVGVVPNGVESPSIMNCREAVRERLKVPQDLLLAVCVSRITVEKGYATLAEGLHLLDKGGSRFAIVIVGGGDESGAIRAMFKGLQNIAVTFLGHQSNVSQFLEASDLFIFPSLHENLSNALIEALSFGLPVVATDVGGNSEVVQKGGGLLVPPSDPSKLAAAIEQLITDFVLRTELSRRGRENVARNYTVQKMVSGWHDVYKKILGSAQ
ncbi:glycosyltransferase family 4 protein [Variovorax paradoxus]|uniref:glycosyltransferase family 4 protein n=1 Tax=Variovorax paradoxus TaxID=34073 RepID=UPI000781623C|nr:glycosyltransferase family 4 protein [Variovorax paradoxus]